MTPGFLCNSLLRVPFRIISCRLLEDLLQNSFIFWYVFVLCCRLGRVQTFIVIKEYFLAYQYYLRILIGISQVSASTGPQHLEKEQKAGALMWRTLALFPHVMCWMPFISSGSFSFWLCRHTRDFACVSVHIWSICACIVKKFFK